jgi:hypothetical protein
LELASYTLFQGVLASLFDDDETGWRCRYEGERPSKRHTKTPARQSRCTFTLEP